MIKVINVYKNTRIMEMTPSSNIGLGVKTDNDVDLLRFTFDEIIVGTATLLTSLTDDNGDLVAFPLIYNEEEHSYDLEVTNYVASQTNYTIQVEIVNNDMIWHSKQAEIYLDECLEVGEGEMPSVVDNWLQNANLVMSGYQDQMDQWETEIEQAVTGAENVNIEVEEGQGLYNVTITDREGNEYQAVIYQGKNAIISGATASVDNTVGTPSVNVTMGGSEADRTFAFAFHNLKGDKGDKGDKGEPGAIKYIMVQTLPTEDIQTDALYFVPSQDPTTQDLYDEYMYINGSWELLGQKRIVVDLTDYVKNTDYATSSVGGVVKISQNYGLRVSNGTLVGYGVNYTDYGNALSQLVIDKATLENVITGKNLETANNKVTSISSSSTDTQYPSAKCVYDSQATQDTKITNLENQVFGDETIEGEGTSLTLNNTLKGVFNEIGPKGNTSQTGTPTPSSPIPVNVVSGDNAIQITGKNMFKLPFSSPRTYNGLTFSVNDDGSVSVTGTSTSAGGFKIPLDVPIPMNGNYCFSLKTVGTISVADGQQWLLRNSSNTQLLAPAIRSNATTYSARNINDTATQLEIYTGNNRTLNCTIYPQLELGSTYNPYEEYQGIDTYNIDLPVENLLNIQDTTKTDAGLTLTIQNGVVNITGTYSSNVTFNLSASGTLKAGTYTIGTNANTDNYPLITLKNGNTTIMQTAYNDNGVKTFTLENDTTIDGISLYFGGNRTYQVCKPMLEKGSKSNAYTPYGTTPIELCKIGNYQDYFYKDNGNWYKYNAINKVVLDGTETWNYQYNNGYRTNISDIMVPTTTTDAPLVLSNYYQADTQAHVSASDYGISNRANQSQIIIKNINFNSVADVTSWLSSNNTTLYYVLATPTNTEITYEPLIDQLNAIEQAQSKENQTNISQVNNDLPFIISASAFLNNINGKIGLLNKLTEV